MTPVAIIQKLLQVNPTVAKFILAGLGVLAAASLAVTWIGGNPQALYLAGYILGLAFLATIIAFVANNRWMCLVLGWAVTGTFIAFLVVAYVLGHIVQAYEAAFNLSGLMAGLQAGFWCWLGFVAAIRWQAVAYEDEPLALYGLNLGYNLLCLLAIGALHGWLG